MTNYFGIMGSPYAASKVRHGFFQYHQYNATGDLGMLPTPQSPRSATDGLAKTLYSMERIAAVINGTTSAPASAYTAVSHWFNSIPIWTGWTYGTGNGATPVRTGSGQIYQFGTVICPQWGINPGHGDGPVPIWPMLYASSYHPGGANALLADGSVQYLSESTSQNILNAMCSNNLTDDTY